MAREHEIIRKRIRNLGGLPLSCGCLRALDANAIDAQIASGDIETVIPALLATLDAGHQCPPLPPPRFPEGVPEGVPDTSGDGRNGRLP